MMPGVSADNVPTVVTLPATGIGATNATLWSNITNTGGSDIISYGFEYGTTTSYGNMVSSKAEYIYAGGLLLRLFVNTGCLI